MTAAATLYWLPVGYVAFTFYLACLCVRDCDARGYQFPCAHLAKSHPEAEERLCNYRKGKEEAATKLRSWWVDWDGLAAQANRERHAVEALFPVEQWLTGG